MRNKTFGGTMLIVLAVLAGLLSLLALTYQSKAASWKRQIQSSETKRLSYVSESAMQRAMAIISTIEANAPSLSTDEWATFGNEGSEAFRFGEGQFRVQILDATRFVDLNVAPQAHLERMPFTTEQIDSLLDWREAGLTPRTEGAKDEYYNNLPQPYNAKLRPLDRYDELLLVKGFTPQTLYYPQDNVVSTYVPSTNSSAAQPAIAQLSTVNAYSPNTTETGTAKLSVNTANLQAMIQRGISAAAAQAILARRQPRITQLSAVLNFPGVNQNDRRVILDEFSVDAQTRVRGKLNLNTVSEEVLNTLPNITPDAVQGILQRQSQGFTRLSDVISIPGAVNIVDSFSVTTNSFVVRIWSRVGQSTAIFEGRIDIEQGTPRWKQLQRMPYEDWETRWNWVTETTSDTVLLEND